MDSTNRDQDDMRADDRGAAAGDGHEDVLRWLSRELDGELPAREQVLLADHLDGCPRCAEVARDWRATRKFLRADADAAARRAPVGLTERIMARLAPAPVEPVLAGAVPTPLLQLPMRLLRRSAAVAAACMIALAGAWFATEPAAVSATSGTPALGRDDPALQRVLERWQKGRTAPPSFFELALPAER